MLSFKTNVAEACIQTVSEAMEAIGGQSFYRKNELERLFRDVQAAPFHPLPKWEQYVFTGERLLAE
ncbi:MAG: acyl-CoA/acyl-ACP dehydrogenase [Lewinellaceae bacterium]|nr:acyl-CoA/acyl-ACP dehydrogenase [Lewinellaceae bacterium]